MRAVQQPVTGGHACSIRATLRTRSVVIVTNTVPGHDIGAQQSGSARYLQGIIDHFRALGLEVTLIGLSPAVDFIHRPMRSLGMKLIGPSFRRIGIWVIVISPVAIARTLAWKLYVRLPRFLQPRVDALRLALRRSRGYAHSLGRMLAARDQKFIRNAVARIAPDFVVYDGMFNSCGRLSSSQHWLITHDVKHQRAASFRAHAVSVVPTSFTHETERQVLAEIGNVIAIQWDDAAEFKRMSPHSRIVVVPVTMPPAGSVRSHAAIPGKCLFVGSGSYHNYDGICWFLEECWPQIRKAVPGASLDIVGSVCFRLSDTPSGVSLRGVVQELDVFYEQASVTVVPLRIGSGLKVKLVEALASDQAVVTTSVGAQGLANFASRPFVVADSSAAFAAETVALLSSPSRQAALRTEAAVCARVFSPQAAFAELDAAMFCECGHA